MDLNYFFHNRKRKNNFKSTIIVIYLLCIYSTINFTLLQIIYYFTVINFIIFTFNKIKNQVTRHREFVSPFAQKR